MKLVVFAVNNYRLLRRCNINVHVTVISRGFVLITSNDTVLLSGDWTFGAA